MEEENVTEKVRFDQMASRLANELRVNKQKGFDGACTRDRETGAIVCIAKKFIKDGLVDTVKYYEVGGSPVFVKGDPSDILKLKKTVGLQ